MVNIDPKIAVRDLSVWNKIVSWQRFAKVTAGVLLRTSQNNWEDTSFRSKYAAAIAEKMRVAIWHFVEPDKAPGPQADTFAGIYKSLPQNHRKWLDCEEIHYWTRDVPAREVYIKPKSPQQYTYLLKVMLDRLEADDPNNLPGIYTRKTFWDDWTLPANEKFWYEGKQYTTPDWGKYLLWNAYYGTTMPQYYIPLEWRAEQNWTFWQDGAFLVDGAEGVIDHNFFNGTLAELDEVFAVKGEIIVSSNPDLSSVHLGWPANPLYQIGQKFGENPAFYKMFGLPGHEGIDFLVILGDNVFAMADGVVEEADLGANGDPYGIHVGIKHNIGNLVLHTIYAHLSRLECEVGDVVKMGDKIALSGSTGNSSGPHLHVTVKVDGYQTPGYPAGIVDPYNLVVAGPIAPPEPPPPPVVIGEKEQIRRLWVAHPELHKP